MAELSSSKIYGDLQITKSLVAGTSVTAGGQLVSTVTTGTAPLAVSSTTKVTNLNADLLDGYNTSTIASASTIPVYNGSAQLVGDITGNAATATALKTGRTVGISGSEFTVSSAPTFDGTSNISIPLALATSGVTAGTYSQITVNNKGIVTAASNPSTLSGYGITDATPFTTQTATTPATANWYRIATSVSGINANSGIFKIDFSGTGVKGRLLFVASCHDGTASGTGLTQLEFASSNTTLGLTQVRVIYNTTASGNYAYVEIYNPTALAITYVVDLIDTTGWSLVSPSTTGSVPTGYTSETLTLSLGMGAYENLTTAGQLVSTVTTGTAPLAVSSTTKVTNLNADLLDGYNTSTSAVANTIPVYNGSAQLVGSITGNAATTTKLATARNVNVSGDVSTASGVSFDGSSDITLNVSLPTVAGLTAGTYSQVSVNAKGQVTAASNPTTLSGYGITDATPFTTQTATTPATSNWYRIAQSAVNIGANSGIFKIDFSGAGVKGRLLFVASCHDGTASGTGLTQLEFATSNNTLGLTQVRVVYNTTASGNYAYVEVYNPTALAITYVVDLIDTTGWSLVSPSTTGSVPTGYTSEALTLSLGMGAYENITTAGQLVSTVTTGTAPLAVSSTTKVTNLNADLLDGYNTSVTATANTIPVYNGSAQLVGDVTGNSATTTKLKTARNINVSGDVSTASGVSFDGSSDITLNVSLPTVAGLAAGTYSQLSVNTKGQVTAAANPTSLSGYGITDAAPKTIPSFGGLGNFTTTGFSPLPLFGDRLRFSKPTLIEYYDTTNSVWTTWAGATFDNLTDGRGDTTNTSIDFTHAKFRLTYNISAWTESSWVYICNAYNAPSGSFMVETTKDNWTTTNVRLADTAGVLSPYWRYASIQTPADDTTIRFTFNFSGATSSSPAWGVTQLQLITSRPSEQGAAMETWFPYSWDVNKNITLTGNVTTSKQLVSTITTGTAPLAVSSTTKVTNLNADLLDGYDTSTTAVASKIPVYNGSAQLVGDITGNSATTTKLKTAQTITISGSEFTVSAAPTFDGSAGATIPLALATSGVTAGTYSQITVNNKGIVTAASNPTTLSGYGITDATPFSTQTATTPATANWYRIAQSAVGIGANSAIFKIDFSGTGVKGRLLFVASCHDGTANGTGLTQLEFASSNTTLGLTQARVVYNTTASGNYAYVEIYNPTALAITYVVDLIDTTGWSLVTPNTTGSVPTGYTSEALTLSLGMGAYENITTASQLVSTVTTGTAPLAVSSTTKVTNLNADLLDGYNTSVTATANTIPVYNGSAQLVGSITGNAATATKLATARNFSVTGDVSTASSVSFDGSGDVTLNVSLPSVAGLSAGTYSQVSVNAKGQVTAAANPTTLSGYGINNAAEIIKLPENSSSISYVKVAELTTAIGSNEAGIILYFNGTSDFGNNIPGLDMLQASTRGSVSVKAYTLLPQGSTDIAYGYYNNATSGKTEIWIKRDAYNYTCNIIVGMASSGVNYGNLLTQSTDPGITYVIKDQFALLASPTFTGTPKSTTPSASDNSTNIATTAYVKAQGYITSTSASSLTDVSITSAADGNFLRYSSSSSKWVNTMLAASDIPSLTLSKISDAGSAAGKNTGTGSGNVPILDSNGKLDTNVLPALAITDTYVVADQTSMLALTAQVGDVAVRTDLSKSFILKTADPTVLANWQELLTPASPVTSVAGKTGAVTLASSDVGLGNVTNESKSTMFANPTFTGVPTAPTASNADSSTQIATTAFVKNQGYLTTTSMSSSTDTTITNPISGDFLKYNGSKWINTHLASGDIPNLPWSIITSGLPTTISGYGITDAYTKTQSDTNYAKRATNSNGALTGPHWYRIAVNGPMVQNGSGGDRANATITVRDTQSGFHSTTTFAVSYHFGSNPTINLLNRSYYSSNGAITKIRIVSGGGTYAGASVEVYVSANASVSYTMYDNEDSVGWTAVNWTQSDTVPTGFTTTQLDLDTYDPVMAISANNINNMFYIKRTGAMVAGATTTGALNATNLTATSESHLSNGTYADPHSGVSYGLKVSQGIATDKGHISGNLDVGGTITEGGTALSSKYLVLSGGTLTNQLVNSVASKPAFFASGYINGSTWPQYAGQWNSTGNWGIGPYSGNSDNSIRIGVLDNTDLNSWAADQSRAKLYVGNSQVWTTANFDPTTKANLASPTFTGTPAAPTPATSDNSTTIATTAYVKANKAVLYHDKYVVPSGGIASGTSITLPNSRTYQTGQNQLRVIRDGMTQMIDSNSTAADYDYWEVSSTQIKFNYNIPSDSIIEFEIITP